MNVSEAGAAIPRARLSRAEMAKHGLPVPPGVEARAVAARDEDPVTLAAEAALRMESRQRVSAPEPPGLLLFATSVPGERPAAPLLVEVLDLPDRTPTAELSGPRAGTAALLLAARAVASSERVLLLVADAPRAPPGSEADGGLGAGAVALGLGPGGSIALLEGSHSISRETVPSRVVDGGALRETAIPPVPRAELDELVGSSIRGLLEARGLKPPDLARVSIQAPDPRAARRLGKGLGFTDAQMEPIALAGQIGDAGCTGPLLGLLRALEGAGDGERVLVASFAPGGGSDALLFRAQKGLPKGFLKTDGGRTIDVPTYLRWRGVI